MKNPCRLAFLLLVFCLVLPPAVAGASVQSAGERCLSLFRQIFDDADNLEKTRRVVKAMRDFGMVLPTEAKAVLINFDRSKAGFIIELGTAQEVASYIDHAGQRSNTILKSASYNGKQESNDRYKPSKTGFVSQERLESILDVEKNEIENLYVKKSDPEFPPESTKFFVFADTVATRPQGDGHAWVGIRFQMEPKGPWHTVELHVRLLDKSVVKQSKALGVLGNNLIYAVYHQSNSMSEFMKGLKENITHEEHGGLEIDGMHFQGPRFAGWRDEFVAVALLNAGLSETVLITPDARFVPPSQYFHNKNILLHELSPDLSNMIYEATWARAYPAFINATGSKPEDTRHVNWVTLSSIKTAKWFHVISFLEKMHSMKSLNEPIIISKFKEEDPLAQWNRIFHVKNLGILHDAGYPPKTDDLGVMNVLTDDGHVIEYLDPAAVKLRTAGN